MFSWLVGKIWFPLPDHRTIQTTFFDGIPFKATHIPPPKQVVPTPKKAVPTQYQLPTKPNFCGFPLFFSLLPRRFESSAAQEQHLVLHCIGHSMGGLILRGALPKVLEAIDSMAPRCGERRAEGGAVSFFFFGVDGCVFLFFYAWGVDAVVFFSHGGGVPWVSLFPFWGGWFFFYNGGWMAERFFPMMGGGLAERFFPWPRVWQRQSTG